MTQIVSSISGIEIYAPSAGNAPTNSSEVSAIASAYRVVSATATQLYAGTAYLTSVNSTPVSASRAGNAANASLATSAWYDGTGRLISALPDRAAVSSIASGYVSGVSATVANNSASWGGGGGSVVSPSGTIVVMNGNEVEGTNSAAITGLTGGYNSIIGLIASVVDVGPSPVMLSYDRLADGYTGGNFAFRCNSPIWNTVVFVSGRDSTYGTASASASAVNGDYDVLVPQGSIVSDFMAWTDGGWIHVSALEASAAPSKVVTDIGELAWNSALTGVSATVANNSASWGQGGVSSATVSSIASSYAESAASGVTDTVSSNSATWGQGGPVTSTASAAASAYTSTSTSVSSFTGVSSVNGSALLARTLLPDAQQASGNAHFHFMPTATPWGSTEYTGVLSPLQYATGAALAMKQTKTYGAYYKGNEWFISDVGSSYTAANGVVRAELHRTRGIHLYGSSLNSATGFHLNGSGVDGKSGESAWQYGPTEYNMLTAVNDTVSSNSATWAAAGVDSATCSAIASSYAQDVSAAVSGTVDTVSSQSANWGGSALALSAGPGVKLERVGDTLVAGLDETVLWSGSASLTTAGKTISLSESRTNFDRIKIYGESWVGWTPMLWGEVSGSGPQFSLVCSYLGAGSDAVRFCQSMWVPSGNDFIISGCKVFSLQGATASTSTPVNTWVRLVVGVNRTAGV